MNERITQLAEQAGFENGHQDRYGNSLSQELEQFAELIVKECVSIVAKRKNQAIDGSWLIDEAMSMAEIDLLEHFEVKE